VITINEPIQDLLVGRGLTRARSTVIMNSVDEARFRSSAKASVVTDAAADPAFVMMYHGTLTRLYGLDIAIEAFGTAHQEMPGAELWILGSGPESVSLQSLAQQRGLASKVKLVGVVQPADIPEWLSKCDAGILPIRRDVFLEFAFPNKLAEFIIMGKAVLVSRLKAIRHYFSENALAYCEPNSPADLAKEMVRVYRDGGLRARLAANARNEYAPIRWDIMKERYLSLIGDLVETEAEAAARSCIPAGGIKN
jgi:glycosyltransferase involved in cell wall biosynthesis